jgi:serine/threonine protein kinase
MVIHRDLKSTNVLLDDDWRAKICDHSYAIGDRSPEIRTFTCGTYEFMSPEMACGEPYGSKTDIFSFGVILLEPSGLAPPEEKSSRGRSQDAHQGLYWLKRRCDVMRREVSELTAWRERTERKDEGLEECLRHIRSDDYQYLDITSRPDFDRSVG